MLSRSLVLLVSSLPLFSCSLSSPHVISLPLTRHTYDRMPNPHEIHTMATGTQVLTQGCAVNNFFTPVQIGVNQYRLTVDSLMATTAIADAKCTNCGVSPVYVPGPTAAATGGSLAQTYPSGKGWKGITYTDDFTIPGQTTLPKINIGFGGITAQVGGFFPSSRCDGLNSTYNSNQGTLGLGPSISVLPGTTPFFDTLQLATTPRIDPIMAFQMCSVGGRLWLGGYDNTFMIGLPSFTPLVGTTSYAVIITDMLYGGVTTGLPSTAFGTVVLDTTSTNMTFPQTVYNTLTKSILANPDFVAAFGPTFFSDGVCIPPKSGVSIDTLNAILPHLTISMGTQVILDMQPISSYIREYITLTPKSTTGITDTKRYCPGISVSTIATNTTLGWTFLNQFTTVIDRLNTRVGFARTSNCGGFVGADANFINIPTTTTTTPTPFTQTPAFIGVIVAVVVVSLVLLGVAIFFGRRYYNSSEYKSRMSSLNYSTNAPNVKVQFADPVVGSKGFLGPTPTQQQQPLTRNAASSASSLQAPGRGAAYSVEEDGVFTDSPLASSPLSSMNNTPRNNYSQQQQQEMSRMPPRAMVAQRGMMGAPQQQQWGGGQQQQQQQIRNPGQLSTPEQAPPRKVYGGVGGARGGGGQQQASEWAEAFDQEGNPYYYNARTQETTWDRPAGFVPRSY